MLISSLRTVVVVESVVVLVFTVVVVERSLIVVLVLVLSRLVEVMDGVDVVVAVATQVDNGFIQTHRLLPT